MTKNETIENFIHTCHLIQHKGLVSGTGGNVSFRDGNTVYITPTGTALAEITENNICTIEFETGKSLNGLKPSKEMMMHLMCYKQRNDISAVIHVHSAYSIALASLPEFINKGTIPIFTPGYGLRIGKIPIIPYEMPGSVSLAKEVSLKIANRDSVLLANHGVVAAGKNTENALNIIEEIEENAKIYFITNGKANELTSDQIQKLNIYR